MENDKTLYDGDGFVTDEEFQERKLDIACRIVVNLIKAGEVDPKDLRIRDQLLQLPMSELTQKLLESYQKAEEHGLPLAYRLGGVRQ